MNKPCEYYKISRERAGLSQEQAAEFLSTSARHVRRIELGESRAPDDMVMRMECLYRDPMLWVYHLMATSEVAAAHMQRIIDGQTGDVRAMISQLMALCMAISQTVDAKEVKK